jgi:mono/diheme cytochrome c family protein
MLIFSRNNSALATALRLLALTATPLIVIATACSVNKPQTGAAIGTDVTKTTKNPLADLNAAAEAGKALYAVNCASCHGDDGRGDGDYAVSLPAKPSDLTANNVVSAADGEIFLIIRDGKMRDGKITMAPARGVSVDQMWRIVTYIRVLSQNKAEKK